MTQQCNIIVREMTWNSTPLEHNERLIFKLNYAEKNKARSKAKQRTSGNLTAIAGREVQSAHYKGRTIIKFG